MKKLFLTLAVVTTGFFVANAQTYTGKTTEISFFSDGIIEDISAKNSKATPILLAGSGDVVIKVAIESFIFDNGLMQEHFNENYMESKKYPYGTFTGKIQEKIDYTKDGTHKITIKGNLEIHGVKKERTLDATLTIKGSEVTIDSKFDVKLKDHNIEVPEMMMQKIAEVVAVTVKSTLAKK